MPGPFRNTWCQALLQPCHIPVPNPCLGTSKYRKSNLLQAAEYGWLRVVPVGIHTTELEARLFVVEQIVGPLFHSISHCGLIAHAIFCNGVQDAMPCVHHAVHEKGHVRLERGTSVGQRKIRCLELLLQQGRRSSQARTSTLALHFPG